MKIYKDEKWERLRMERDNIIYEKKGNVSL